MKKILCFLGRMKYEYSKFVFRKRKKPTANKPEGFLIQLKPKFEYISSLFPAGEEGLYTFDYQKQVYILKKEQEQVLIEKQGTE